MSTKRAFTFFVMASLATTPALAQRRGQQPQTSGLTGEADQHFTAGIRFASIANYVAAAVEYHRAYDLSHNPLVLLNLAATELELNHFQEAAEALTGYEQGVPAATRPQEQPAFQALWQRIRQRSGVIEVQFTHPGLRVEIQGAQSFRVLREGEAANSRIYVPVGRYRVLLSAPNFRPREQQLDIGPEEAIDIGLALDAVTVAFTLRSNVEDAEVSVDGTVVGRTPLPPQHIPQGRHRIEVRRPGYEVFRAEPEFNDGNASLDVRLQWLSTIAPELAAHVLLVSTHNNLSVLLDQHPIDPSGADAVPPGRHTLRITGPDIEPHEEQIELPAGRRTTLTPTLTLRRELALAQANSASARRTVGYIVSGLGAATMIGGGIALGLTASSAAGTYQTQANFERIIEGCGERVGQLGSVMGPREQTFVSCVNRATSPPSNYSSTDGIASDAFANAALSNAATTPVIVASVVTGVGLVALAAGIIVVATAGAAPTPSRTARLTPRIAPTSNGFVLQF
ncbi:MAG: PEGA domain-containing protein [Deltaproteobacteria bacterium]|nr:PEGA domain-containing protein [Deltaproteobacteria bacterium]